MELRLTPLDSVQSVARAIQALTRTSPVQGKGFQVALAEALQATSALQKESGRLSMEFTLDNPTVSLEEIMIAGQKSGIAKPRCKCATRSFRHTATLRTCKSDSRGLHDRAPDR